MKNTGYVTLRHAIYGAGFTQKDVAMYLGISATALSQKLSGAIEWSLYDIHMIGDLLRIGDDKILALFPRGISKISGRRM